MAVIMKAQRGISYENKNRVNKKKKSATENTMRVPQNHTHNTANNSTVRKSLLAG